MEDSKMRGLLFAGDVAGLATLLVDNPALVSAPMSLPGNAAKAHPLHRICDGVFGGYFSEETGLALARLFVEQGANVNIDVLAGEDSPLTTACSLRCDKLALFYIERGAAIQHQGCHGGTALHWASWCGRDVVVEALLARNADINARCIDFNSTPLFWAMHGYKSGGIKNRHHQAACVRMLLDHGADPSIPNFEGYLPVQLAQDDDTEILDLFKNRRSGNAKS